MKKIAYIFTMTLIVMSMLWVGAANAGVLSVTIKGSSVNYSGVSAEHPVDTQTPTETATEITVSEAPATKASYETIAEYLAVVKTCGRDENISEGERYEIVLNGEAFIDRETCLIWEMNPLQFYGTDDGLTFQETTDRCNNLTTGNRYDWRVPSLFELVSLGVNDNHYDHPWNIDLQCHNLNYGGVGEYHCMGWTSTPAIGGPVGSHFTILMYHGALSWGDLNDKAYPFCVRGVANSGHYDD